ncbi:TPA: TolC family protein, partial [Vibrio cholerae]
MNKGFLTACVLTSLMASSSAFALSIEQAWQQAKQQSPDAHIAELSVQLSVQDKYLAKSDLLP